MGVYDLTFRQAAIWVGGGIFALSTASFYAARMGGSTPRTLTKEWREAEKEYKRFQNMDPIGLGGRETYTPSYMQAKKE